MNSEGRHPISLAMNTVKRLRAYGGFGDSYDDIVSRLLDVVEEKEEKKRGIDR